MLAQGALPCASPHKAHKAPPGSSGISVVTCLQQLASSATYCLPLTAYCLLLTPHYSLTQGATRAASRLAAVQFTDDSAHHRVVPFVVPPDRVRLVACAAGASEFAAAMAALALDGALAACRDGDGCRGGTLATCRGTLALDAEWRPDVGASCHLPSLVQAATLCTLSTVPL